MKQEPQSPVPHSSTSLPLPPSSPTYAELAKPLLYAEFDRASDFDAKRVIVERAVKALAKSLNVHQLSSPSSSSSKITIHPEVSKLVERLYESCVAGDSKPDMLTMKFTAFKSSDCHELAFLKSFTRDLQKSNEICHAKKDKILKDNRLHSILAVDGMRGPELHRYLRHMSVGSDDDPHVAAVRRMYATLPPTITGSDSAQLVTKTLLEQFRPHNGDHDLEALIDEELKRLDHTLFKQSQHYKELTRLTELTDALANVYKSCVKTIPTTATIHLQLFFNYYKKQQQQKKKRDDENEEPQTKKPKTIKKEPAKKKKKEQKKTTTISDDEQSDK